MQKEIPCSAAFSTEHGISVCPFVDHHQRLYAIIPYEFMM
jgi:hypothetical protein